MFVSSERSTGDTNGWHEHKIWVCGQCGQFRVTGFSHGQTFEVEFVLPSAELVAAAGRYVEYLAAQKGQQP